jgi:phosphoenolpyruvate-protein kinase (PTS system EI component)
VKEIIATVITLMKEKSCSAPETVTKYLSDMMKIAKHDYAQFVKERENDINHVYKMVNDYEANRQ